MTQEKMKSLLSDMFIPRDNGDGVCFSNDYMDKENVDKYATCEAVSSAMHDSGLSFDFSYNIANRAVNVIIDSDIDLSGSPEMINDNLDALHDFIDSYVPVYNNELMEIYAHDHTVVDEEAKNFGSRLSSVESAQFAWYAEIEEMTTEITHNLSKLLATGGLK